MTVVTVGTVLNDNLTDGTVPNDKSPERENFFEKILALTIDEC